MARQILIGVYAEGPTDYRYFPTLLRRYVIYLCQENDVDAEIMQPQLIERKGGTFLEQMKSVEAEYRGLQYIFVHNDADGRTTNSVIENKWKPWMGQCESPERWIPVIPVKKLESWLLVDGEALASTFIISTDKIREILGNSNPERIPNPKSKLDEIIQAGKQRRARGYEENLAERTRFSELEKLPSFQNLKQCLMQTMFRQTN